MFCPNCGNKISNGAKFCKKCGYRIDGQASKQNDYQEPDYQSVQDTYPDYAYYEQQNYQPKGGRKAAKRRKTQNGSATMLIAIIAACLVLVGAGIGGFFLFRGRKGGVEQKYDALCELTAHGTESYVHARMLTEQLLQTDLMAADPETVNKRFEECLAMWDAIGDVSGKMVDLADDIADKASKIKSTREASLPGVMLVYADGGVSAATNMQTAAESITSCSRLGTQYYQDASSAVSQIRSLQAVYQGRGTSITEWNNASRNVSQALQIEVMLSGEMIAGNGVTGVSSSIHTLTRKVKSGAVTVTGVTNLVSVGDTNSAIIVGQNDSGVVANQDEIVDFIPPNSSVVAVSSEVNEDDGSRITFHEESILQWFVQYTVSGYRISRRNKGGNAIAPPETGFTATSYTPPATSTDSPEVDTIVPTSEVPDLPEPVAVPVDDWTRDTGRTVGNPQDVRDTTNEIVESANGNSGNINSGNTSQPPESYVPTESQMDEGVRYAGVGPITVSLSWGSYDDVDLHMDTPDGSHIYFSNKVAGGGNLDIDMNASGDLSLTPVENIYFSTPEAGHYKVSIKNYRDRTDGVPTHYLVRVTVNGESSLYEGTIDKTGTEIVICEFDYGGNGGVNTPPINSDTLGGRLAAEGADQGEITVSMLWGTQDDIDLHIITPDESHIYYRNKSTGGGTLDVDANASGNMMDLPVENIFFPDPQNGHYKVYIHMFNDRTPNQSAEYLVKVSIGNREPLEFSGRLDTTGTEVVIYEFDYNSGRSGQIPDNATEYNGHHYSFYDQSMTWLEARDYCASLGGHLATINDAQEQAFIEATFRGFCGWVGGYGNGAVWKWVTDEPMNYTHWGEGEPNYQNDNEWCMHLYTDYYWNDLPNGDDYFHRGFLCEWDNNTNVFNEDSIAEAVSQAGGQTGKLTISMMWNTEDDLDLHVITPSGKEICFDDTREDGGELDVDMIPSYGTYGSGPYVENVYFDAPAAGNYYVIIYDYDDRSNGPTDYMVSVKIEGEAEPHTFRGTIDGTDTYLDVVTCTYGNAGR